MANKSPRPRKQHKEFAKETRTSTGDMRDDFAQFTIAVAIEWDGIPPKMTWYDRLHRKGIWVRGGDENEFPSPLARRRSLDTHNVNNGIVWQEGLYLVRNEDLAKELAYEAQQFGASSVMIGRLFMNVFTASKADLEVLDTYFKTTSKRGRKPVEQAGTYTITCFDELLTFELDLEAIPPTCPICQTFRFQAHLGKQKVYGLPKWSEIDNLYEYWLCSRFDSNGVFEIPLLQKATKTDIKTLPPLVPHVNIPEPNLYFPKSVKLSPEMQLRVWDACYSLSQASEEHRIHGRLGVLGAYWNAGGDDVSMSMAAPEDGYDVVDMCILLGKDFDRYLWKGGK